MDHSKKSTYLFSVDALRVFAILAVIMIHQTTTTLQHLDHDVNMAPFSLFLNQAARFAVPLFFLISGFVLELNSKSEFSYSSFFKKRASRILTPFIFWSAIYFLIGHGFKLEKLFSKNFFSDILTGQAAYHLYFIPTLIIFYLLFPYFHKLIKLFKNPMVLAAGFLLQLILAFYNYYLKPFPIQEDLRVALLVFAMFIIGMASSHYKDEIILFAKKSFLLLTLLLVCIIIYIFFHVNNLILRLHTTSFIYNQYGPLNYIYTILLSLVTVAFLEKTKVLKNIVITLSKLSFFVFFVHVIVLQNTWMLIVNASVARHGKHFLTNFWFDTSIFLVVVVTSFFIAYLIHKVPYASKITG